MKVVIDSGGTTTRIAFSKNKTNFSDILKYPTPKKFQDYKGLLQSVITKNLNGEQIDNLVYGVAGSINRYEKIINKSPHNNCLNNKKITEILDFIDFDSTNVLFENDASLAALAEAILGEGKNFNRVAYITISTGVGGALIKEKRISDTKYNFEPGHHIINFEGEALALENIKGSFESYSSGTGFKARYGVDPAEHDDADIWNDYGRILGIGLHNISLLWQPEIIVLGGSMSKKASLFIKSLNSSLEETLLNKSPEIRISTLGDENGLIGGLELLNLSN
jgi:glucokinase